MIYNNFEEGLDSIMFPIREANVYVDTGTGTGRYRLIPNKKAIINSNTNKVLSVVSENYQVLHNYTALELARKCCEVAFPNTTPAKWEVFSVEAPLTHAHCRIDLQHNGEIPGYEWSFGKDKKDRFKPFIRVCNSYNRTFAFSIRFGLIRGACTNGLVDWHSSITIKVAHDVKKMERSIEKKIDEAKFKKVVDEFGTLLKPLFGVLIDEEKFLPLILSILHIKKPEDMSKDRESKWNQLEKYLTSTASTYIQQIGSTGYALMNAVSDVATRPTNIRKGNFVRRERDGLQRLVGMWLVNFSKLVEHQTLLNEYLEKPSQETLRPKSLARF